MLDVSGTKCSFVYHSMCCRISCSRNLKGFWGLIQSVNSRSEKFFLVIMFGLLFRSRPCSAGSHALLLYTYSMPCLAFPVVLSIQTGRSSICLHRVSVLRSAGMKFANKQQLNPVYSWYRQTSENVTLCWWPLLLDPSKSHFTNMFLLAKLELYHKIKRCGLTGHIHFTFTL